MPTASGGERGLGLPEAAAQETDGARLAAAVAGADNQGGSRQSVAALLVGYPSTPGALADEAVLVDGVAAAHLRSTIGLCLGPA